ncbi:lytic transglycosylase domain-containing protein [Actinomadura syzygii]|uniref:Lytic transglycosylase domain-containing protein n=1 Tax=Actinomadura syzygii TaxID=1427538 RepID=A0A5D0UIA4_9ACTN|nr:lytic transglycosylase domain-containing protein [Actinomadura syzygii]TYC17323.1 lytic transglycosylase domain-containing protein [Actinomadura syzygii]
MPQSHGTRRRPSAPAGRARSGARRATRGPGSDQARGGVRDDREPRVPAPREPSDPLDDRPSGGRRLRRMLTSNVTIMIVAIGALAAAVVLVDIGRFVDGGTKPPKAAAPDLSTNDMLAKLTSASDMDAVTADAIAAAKKRAYELHQRELKRLKEQAKRDAAARAKLKEQQERERLAKMNPSAGQNKDYGKKMNALKGWGRCWSSLLTLWNHESGWNERAENPGSGAYGIPQALPGSKMMSAGPDWRTSTPTQIAWGLGYIKARYTDPCGAWAWWSSHHWY